MTQPTTQVPTAVSRLFAQDERIVVVTHYVDGFVPNSYHYRAPGQAVRYTRTDAGITAQPLSYDRKRSHGRGPAFVGMSAKGGRLASL